MKRMIEGHVAEDSQPTRRKFKAILNFCKNPNSIFEIGFQGGNSTRLFLELNQDEDFHIHSIDIGDYDYVEELAKKTYQLDNRFSFEMKDSLTLTPQDLSDFDMVFIDGGHSEEIIESDINVCMDANVKYILIDDFKADFPAIRVRTSIAVEKRNYVWVGEPMEYLARDRGQLVSNWMRLAMRDDLVDTYPPVAQKLFTKT